MKRYQLDHERARPQGLARAGAFHEHPGRTPPERIPLLRAKTNLPATASANVSRKARTRGGAAHGHGSDRTDSRNSRAALG